MYQIALTMVEGVGPINAKNLIAYCGSASEVFKAKKSSLLKIPEVGEVTAAAVYNFDNFRRAEAEVKFIESNSIHVHFYASPGYPYRLKDNRDCPVLLYQLGNMNLNCERIVGVVGTRKPSEMGKLFCDKLIADLAASGIMVISGMAFGIDICAHQAAIKNNVPTVGVMAHGLDRIYPAMHKKYSRAMINNKGGFISEYISGTQPDRENFPKRNRIVAGLCDAMVVIETAKRGGSMITAELAWQYNRSLLAIPGRPSDEKSEGCNYLIKTNRAELMECADDLLNAMNWSNPKLKEPKQRSLPLDLSGEQLQMLGYFADNKVLGIDEIIALSSLPNSRAALVLLDLEFKGLVQNLPGKRYQLI